MAEKVSGPKSLKKQPAEGRLQSENIRSFVLPPISVILS